MLERLILTNPERVVSVTMAISSEPLVKADVPALVMKLSGQPIQGARRRWPQETLDTAEVDYGVSFTLTDGRKGMYTEIWRRTPDGRIGITGYLAIASEFDAQHKADFKTVRSYSNQLARGGVLIASPRPNLSVEPEPVIANLPSIPPAGPISSTASAPSAAIPSAPVASAPAPVAAPLPSVVPNVAASVPVPTPAVPSVEVAVPVAVPVPSPAATPAAVQISAAAPSAAAPIITPQPVLAMPVAVPATAAPAVISAATTYPFVAAAGAGVSTGQVASILYAPLESSEVFVLFKDGSFHENLPVALEQWNLAASRSKDPGSWGKWKPSEDAGDYDMQYAADDIVTISATKIKPAKAGMLIEGSFAKSSTAENDDDHLSFIGNRFESVHHGQKHGGTYRVDGYSIILTHDDGRIEHQPFFVVPPEDAEDEPSIWLGESLYDKIEDG